MPTGTPASVRSLLAVGGRGALSGRLRWGTLLALALAFASAEAGMAQLPEGDVSGRVAALQQAFQGVADAAASGAWPQADTAFNGVLETLDRYRPAMEAELGSSATDVFAAIDGLLADLDLALKAEDELRVQAVVGVCRARLGRLLPGAVEGGPPEEATADVLRWRSAVEVVVALAEAGAWRDARNAAIELHADIRRRSPAVRRAVGAAGEWDIATARVFALRLRDAALDQSLAGVQAAASIAQEATQGLLRLLGIAPTATLPAEPARGTSYQIAAVLEPGGERAVAVLVARAVPRPGLGACRVRVRWSPQALRLGAVQWLAGEGTLRRDDLVGEAELSLPPAPSGPSGDVTIARLELEVVGSTVDPRAYLPAEELARIEGDLADASEAVRRGDLPDGARLVTDAYIVMARGRGRPGSLYQRLDEIGHAEDWSRKLLAVLESLSEPAATDVIVAGLAESRALLQEALSAYLRHLDPDGIPITVEVLEAYDTAGQPLPLAPSQQGVVPLRQGQRTVIATLQPERTRPSSSLVRPELPPTASTEGTPTPAGLAGLSLVPGSGQVGAVVTEGQMDHPAAPRPIGPRQLLGPLLALTLGTVLASLAAMAGEPGAALAGRRPGTPGRPGGEGPPSIGAGS